MGKRHKPRWGYTASGRIEEYPLGNVDDNTKFEILEESLKATISHKDRKSLNDAASYFLMFRNISNPPRLNESKAACRKIKKGLKPAIDILNKIDKEEAKTKDMICSLSPKARLYLLHLDTLISGLTSISEAAEQLIQKKATDKDSHRPVKHSSLWQLIADLAPIYEKITGKRATGHIVSPESKKFIFVDFVILCIRLILNIEEPLYETLKESEAFGTPSEYSTDIIARAVQEVLSLIKLKDKQERSIGNHIPADETDEGALRAYHAAREKNKQEVLDHIKKLRKR